jgi:xanthine dehydrogenase iron-sulfur cluster and FAD-binding subunit A
MASVAAPAPETAQQSAPAGAAAMPAARDNYCHCTGCHATVEIARRCGKGMNKPGGIARIVKGNGGEL